MKLRDYQEEAINSIYEYFNDAKGNPIVCVPTGGGKSVIIGQFVAGALGYYPNTRIMILSHVKELLEQNYNKLMTIWPNAPAGLYSAGLGIKQSHRQVTVAGIQSVYKKSHLFGWIDLILVDECHLLSPNSETMYQAFIAGLKKVNPKLKVIGFSATPFRTKDGMLTYGEGATFTDICYNVPIRRLIDEGYLVPLVSRSPEVQGKRKGLATTGGDFNMKAAQAAYDNDDLTGAALEEVFEKAHDRKSWLIFCTGIQHAEHVTLALRERGIAADFVSGETSDEERARILNDLKTGKLRAVCNYGVLTTGFDAPNIDCIILLRPTKSAGLYIQMLGRGTRVIYAPGYDLTTTDGRHAAIAASPKQNCLVLDFAGNIENFGPVDKIEIVNPRKKGEGGEGGGISIVPQKICPVSSCRAPNHARAAECEYCGYEFPIEVKHGRSASDSDILSAWKQPEWFDVSFVQYAKHEPIDGRPPSLRINYQCGIQRFSEWVALENERAARKAGGWWLTRAGTTVPQTVDEALARQSELRKPERILIDQNKKYPEILNYAYANN